MMKRPSTRVQDCYSRADDCARQAEAAATAEEREFWEEQETRWIRIAGYAEFSERVASFLQWGRPEPAAILQEDETGINALADVFDRVCIAMNIGPQDQTLSRAIAQELVKAAMDGEDDVNALYSLAVRAVSY